MYPSFNYQYKSRVVSEIAEEWSQECQKPEKERLSLTELIKNHFDSFGLMKKDDTVVCIDDDDSTEEDPKDEGH